MFQKQLAEATEARLSRRGHKNMPAESDTSMTEETEGLLSTVPLETESGDKHTLPLSHAPPTTPPPHSARTDALRLLFGAGGIYASFLFYGSLQEDVFRYEASDGTKFDQAWFLQFLEAMANVAVGFVGMKVAGGTKNIPQKFFVISGASQVSSKAFTSLSLARGLSFPVATLAKSGKMAPVMAGQLLLGGASYSAREYMQVAAIIGGTAILSMGKKKGGPSTSTPLGIMFILLSLFMDGVTAGVQKRLKADLGKVGVKPKPYDFMFWTNLYMMVVALCIALILGEVSSGMAYCSANPEIFSLIVKFSICSAVGQSFIFYTVAVFDPLVCSTVTTTRKIFSVLLSIFTKGHHLSGQGWAGIMLAISGILSEMQSKFAASKERHLKSKQSDILGSRKSNKEPNRDHSPRIADNSGFTSSEGPGTPRQRVVHVQHSKENSLLESLSIDITKCADVSAISTMPA